MEGAGDGGAGLDPLRVRHLPKVVRAVRRTRQADYQPVERLHGVRAHFSEPHILAFSLIFLLTLVLRFSVLFCVAVQL